MDEQKRKDIEDAVVSVAQTVKSRIDKHWKVDKEVTEEAKARNLDYGTVLDYYETETKVPESNVPEVDAEVEPELEPEIELEPPVEIEEDVWEKALDENTKRWYYFNRKSGITQWEMPENATILEPEVEETTHSEKKEKQAVQELTIQQEDDAQLEGGDDEHKHKDLKDPIWYYKDINACVQGPFLFSLLKDWMPYLPMDIQTWCKLEGPEQKENALDEIQNQWDESAKAEGTPILPEGQAKSITYAELMGFKTYLKDWQEERGVDNCIGYGIAPAITSFERMLSGLPLELPGGHDHAGSTYPSQNWQSQSAQLGGTSSSHTGQNSFASQGFFNKRTRRFQANEGMIGTVSDALDNVPSAYFGTGLSHHMDISTLDEQMQLMKEQKKVKLSREAIEKLKARKKEVKKKMKKQNMPWLYGND